MYNNIIHGVHKLILEYNLIRKLDQLIFQSIFNFFNFMKILIMHSVGL